LANGFQYSPIEKLIPAFQPGGKMRVASMREKGRKNAQASEFPKYRRASAFGPYWSFA
jgi:hypothetical protein